MKKARSLYKAQMGGGTEQDNTYKQLATAVHSAIKRGQSPNDVYEGLIASKVNKDIALKIVSGIVEYMISNGELEEEDLKQQAQNSAEEEQQRMQQQPMGQQDVIVDQWQQENPSGQPDAYAQEMEMANQQSMDIANEDEEDLTGYQDGGEQAVMDQYDKVDEAPQANEIVDYSKLIASTPGTQNVQFPGIEEYYLPYNPLMTGDFQLDYEEPKEKQTEQGFAKYGGSQVKRKFTNEVFKLLKKQAGGTGEPQEDEVVNSGKAKQTDDLSNSVKKVKDTFINAISGQAKKVAVGNWFEKLKQNNDPMLEQILNPPPKGNPLEEKKQQEMQMQQALSSGQMQRGGSSKQYNRLAKKIYNQMAGQIPIPKGFNVPVSFYDKRAPFVNQRFSTIGGPQINKYFELLAQMYPKAKSATEQANEAVMKNNMLDAVVNNSGNTGINANPIWAQLNNFNVPKNPYKSNTPFMQEGGENGGLYSSALNEYDYFLQNPEMWKEDPEMLNEDGSLNLCLDCINVDYTNRKHVEDAARLINEGYTTGTHRNEKVFRDALNQFGIAEPVYKSVQIEKKQYGGYMQIPGQYGGATGSDDPSVPALTRFVYGGDDQFPEESKNVNDPYFSDTASYPEMQMGGDATEYTHYTHGADDVFHDQMNTIVRAKYGMNTGNNTKNVNVSGSTNPYLEQLQQLLQQSQYRPKDIRRAMRGQRRMAGNTYRDHLFPANRAIQYSGSWAQQMGLPFTASDGQTYLGDINGPLAKREVTKRGILGRPKQWTDYYMVGDDGNFTSLNPSNTSKITLDPYYNRINNQKESKVSDDARAPRGSYKGMGLIDAGRIRANELMTNIKGRGATEDTRPYSQEERDADIQKFQEGQKAKGLMWDNKQNKWVKGSFSNNIKDAEAKRTPGLSSYEGADLVTGTPGQPVDFNQKQAPLRSSTSNAAAIKSMTNLPGMVGKSDAEIREALIKGTSVPTVVKKGNTVYINAAGNPINVSEYENEEEEYSKGGILRKALLGDQTPVSFTGNPIFEGQSEVDWTTNTAGNTNLQPSNFWSNQQSFNAAPPSAPKQMQEQNAELAKYTVDPNQIEEYQAPKKFQGLIGVNRKRKDMISIDPEAGVNTFNAGVRGALGMIDNRRNQKQEAEMYAKNFDPTQIYGQKSRIDKGDYDMNTGLYRVNQMGADRLGRSKKYGGYMQEGGSSEEMFYPEDNMAYPPGDSQYPMAPLNRDIMAMLYNKYYSNPYQEDIDIEEGPTEMEQMMIKEGGETYMSDEQINAFLAAGGQIEYL